MECSSHHSLLFETYNREIDRLPVFYRNNAAAVLYAGVLAVVLSSCADSPEDVERQCKEATTNDFFDPNSGEIRHLTAVSSPGLLSCLTKVVREGLSYSSPMNKPTSPLTVEGGDHFSKILLTSEIIETKRSSDGVTSAKMPAQATVVGLRNFELQALIRLQILRLLPPDGIPLWPPMSAVERGIKETELLTFSSLCSTDLYRSNQLQQFEEMILEKTKNLPNFTGALSSAIGEDGSVLKRKYFRYVSAFLFAQILSKEIPTEPIVLKRYYEMTDELLYCLHWPPPNRRNKKEIWTFPLKNESSEFEGIRKICVDSVTMTPAGKAVAMLRQIDRNGNNPWLTAYYHDCMVGFRLFDSKIPENVEHASVDVSAASFFLQTDDDVRVSVFPGPKPLTIRKPDKCGSICLRSSYPSGLSVTVCTNGDIRMESNVDHIVATTLSTQSCHQYKSYPLLSEVSRFIGKGASICRSFGDTANHPFEKEIFLVNGTREIFLKSDYSPVKYKSFLQSADIFEAFLLSILPIDVRWVTLYPDGTIESCNLSEDGVSWIRNPSVNENIMEELIDAETKSISRYFKDGRLITVLNTGAQIVRFPDQTQYLVQPSIGMVFLTRGRGWPTVEIDNEIDSVSRSHSLGLEVPINKGGDRTRLRLALPDGSAIFVKYDTRVTAKTNGSLKLISRSRSSIVARDDGSVLFTPSTAWTKEDDTSFQSDCKVDDIAAADKPHTTIMGAFPITAHGVGATDPSPLDYSNKMAVDTRLPTSTSTPFERKNLKSTSASSKSTKPRIEKKNKVMNTVREIDEHHGAHDLFASSTEPDAVICVNVLNGKCTIQDYEYNSFEMDIAFNRKTKIERSLEQNVQEGKSNSEEGDVHNKKRETAMDVTVLLAGEVPGLKPPAVARYPKPPRLFVINRNGEATEILSLQEVSSLEHRVATCPDTSRFDATSLIPPSELGPAKLIKYFSQKRFLMLPEECFSFSEVFGHRNYHKMTIPASTLHFLHSKSNTNHCSVEYSNPAVPAMIPRVFESISLVERPPLSNQGYEDILSSFKRCEEFRARRLQSIDRFAVDDPRTSDQIEEEEQIVKRLKQAYKIAKINAAKRKEQHKERDDRIAEEEEEDEETTSQSNSKAGATKGSKETNSPTKRGQKEITILESQMENKEEDEEIEQFSEDDENAEMDPEIVVTKNAFDDYASPSALVSWGGDVMPVHCLQEVFIRVFNRFISQEDIDTIISHTEEIEPGLEELTLNEFRGVYRSMKKMLNGESFKIMEAPSPRDDFNWGESSDSLEADLASEITGGSAYMAMMSSPPTGMSSRGGRQGQGKSAPHLNLNNLDWNRNNECGSVEQKCSGEQNDEDKFAAGSAINHIRKVKSQNVHSKM